MKARQQRMIFIGAVLAGLLVSGAFLARALQENLLYFHSPTQVFDGSAPEDRRFRLGGLVEEGSVRRASGSLDVSFVVTDNANSIPVEYDRVLPDLFAEGKGVVAHGRLNAEGVFVADEVLAKHDENYMAPEVADALAKGGEGQRQ
jgi:cytochrome c-type biogenesis protein CcmE